MKVRMATDFSSLSQMRRTRLRLESKSTHQLLEMLSFPTLFSTPYLNIIRAILVVRNEGSNRA